MNALSHGLSATAAPRDPATSAEIERLTTWICGDNPTPAQYECARGIAEAEVMLRRIDAAYVAAIELAGINTAHGAVGRDQAEVGVAVRGETPAGGSVSPAIAPAAVGVALPQLVKLERYKQGALARRRRAMQGFVSACVDANWAERQGGRELSAVGVEAPVRNE